MTSVHDRPKLLRALGLALVVIAVGLKLADLVQTTAYLALATIGIGVVMGAELWKVWMQQRTWRAVFLELLGILLVLGLMFWLL
ncbi:hypothetical protein K7W42_18075 [Deinococcus sp. HMF7604]|uniref:hypothetical protein n=1 Tax=Deinococcus betulae TaxID=2873312 RepID=UPI001CC91A35|nr:hypothetical protein [Deinococcus betulae]MBZ9752752.1 hypothetical protein [Deinococcus betulae]